MEHGTSNRVRGQLEDAQARRRTSGVGGFVERIQEGHCRAHQKHWDRQLQDELVPQALRTRQTSSCDRWAGDGSRVPLCTRLKVQGQVMLHEATVPRRPQDRNLRHQLSLDLRLSSPCISCNMCCTAALPWRLHANETTRPGVAMTARARDV